MENSGFRRLHQENVKKATGADGIPAKIVKASKSVIAPQLSTLINITVDTGVFPDRLKKNSGYSII